MKIARRGEGSEWRSDPRSHRQPTSPAFLAAAVQIQRRSSVLSLRFLDRVLLLPERREVRFSALSNYVCPFASLVPQPAKPGRELSGF